MIPVARRWLIRATGGLVLIVLGYCTAGLIGGALPANAAWRPPAHGVTIWVENNGIHTDLVLPKLTAGVDWRRFAPAADLADPRYGRNPFVAIGWGEHGFYLGTPTWGEVRLGPVLSAAIGSDATLLHVEHLSRPTVGDDVRALVLRPEEYHRLAAFILASRRAGGRRWSGYGRSDVFYEARGRYDAIRTCNSWTGAALRTAGVKVGRWTPFAAGVLRWF